MKSSDRDAVAEVKGLLASPDWQALKAVPPLMLQVRADQAFMLLAQLQLALRHPGNKGPSAFFARTLGATIQKHISVNATIEALCQKGWDPEFDIPREPRERTKPRKAGGRR